MFYSNENIIYILQKIKDLGELSSVIKNSQDIEEIQKEIEEKIKDMCAKLRQLKAKKSPEKDIKTVESNITKLKKVLLDFQRFLGSLKKSFLDIYKEFQLILINLICKENNIEIEKFYDEDMEEVIVIKWTKYIEDEDGIKVEDEIGFCEFVVFWNKIWEKYLEKLSSKIDLNIVKTLKKLN